MNYSALAYDSDCGPCKNFKNFARFLDPKRRIKFVPLIAVDQSGLLDGLDSDTRYCSFHLNIPGRDVASGADALPFLFWLLAGVSRIGRAVFSIPSGFQAVSSVYRILRRLHNSGSCVPPGLGATGSESASGLGLRPKRN